MRVERATGQFSERETRFMSVNDIELQDAMSYLEDSSFWYKEHQQES